MPFCVYEIIGPMSDPSGESVEAAVLDRQAGTPRVFYGVSDRYSAERVTMDFTEVPVLHALVQKLGLKHFHHYVVQDGLTAEAAQQLKDRMVASARHSGMRVWHDA